MTRLVKAPILAGAFYPATADALANQVDAMMASARTEIVRPKGIVAPHAGYMYSGKTAAAAYAALATRRDEIRRVVLVAPSHKLAFKGMAVPRVEAFATSLGEIPVDWPAMAPLLAVPEVAIDDRPFAREHSLEIHLPFLQRVLGPFSLIPIVAGAVTPEQLQVALETVWGGPETAVVISSDLSHFHDYATANGYDRACSKAIELLKAEDIGDHQACGRTGIKALIGIARKLDLRSTTVALCNSGDILDTKDRVVGYGSYTFEQAAAARLSANRHGQLLSFAERSIAYGIRNGKPAEVRLSPDMPGTLAAHRATFVTLLQDGKLRGCIGSVVPHRPLAEDVVINAYKAAFGDPRFPKLTAEELPRCHFAVSILSTPRPIPFRSEEELVDALQPDVDGVILQDGNKRGLFLPQVWEGVPEPKKFVRHLKAKAGLPLDHWSPTVRAWRFGVEKFGRALGTGA